MVIIKRVDCSMFFSQFQGENPQFKEQKKLSPFCAFLLSAVFLKKSFLRKYFQEYLSECQLFIGPDLSLNVCQGYRQTTLVGKVVNYSKTCVKQRLSKRQKIGFQDQLSLIAGQKYCRMLRGEHSAILLTFTKLLFVFKIALLSFTVAILHRFYGSH